VTDAGSQGDRHWVVRLSVNPRWRVLERSVGRADIHATDAGISVYPRWHQQCMKVSVGVSDTASCLLTTQRTRLSAEHGVVFSVSRLSLRQTLDSPATNVSDAGNSTVGEVARRGTWPLCGATDAAVASVGLATDASVTPEKRPVNC
jgi:hypothetical protein